LSVFEAFKDSVKRDFRKKTFSVSTESRQRLAGVLESELDKQEAKTKDREWLTEHMKSQSRAISDMVLDMVLDAAPSPESLTLEWLVQEVTTYRSWALALLLFACYRQHVQNRLDTEPTFETFFANEDAWDLLKTLVLHCLEAQGFSLSRGAAIILFEDHLFIESFVEDEAHGSLIDQVLSRLNSLEDRGFNFITAEYDGEERSTNRQHKFKQAAACCNTLPEL